MEKSSMKHVSRLSLFAFVCLSVYSVSKVVPLNEVAATTGNYEFDLTSYYEPLTASGGQELLGQVHDLIVSTHRTYTSYDDCKNPTNVYATDPGDDEGHVRDFYTRAGTTLDKKWDGNSAGTWNREHVWPQNNSAGLWGKAGGGGDIHHIRPEENRLNGIRGNLKFGEVANRESFKVYAKDTDGKDITDYVGGYKSSCFEPIDEAKGDVARIVLYVYTHYNKATNVGGKVDGSTASYFGTLPITNVIASSSNTAESCFDLLVKWSNDDPVDESEVIRNEAASKMTGTRNAFIDHPYLIDCIWGDGVWTGVSEDSSESSEFSEEESSESEESSLESSDESSMESEVISSEGSAESAESESVESVESSESELIESSEETKSSETIVESSAEESSKEGGSEAMESQSTPIPSSSSTTEKGGCGGSIIGGGIALSLLLAGGAIILLKRRK